ncbi:MAG: GNAT family protein [Bacteroidota bacterium]
MDFSKTYILENDRVRLSPLEMAHAKELAKVSEEAAVWTYFLEKGQGIENLQAYVQSALQKYQAEQEYPFAIYDKSVGAYAGITRLYAYDPDLRIIKMGHTWLGKSFWGTGLNKHCKYLLFQFCFETLGLARIGFGVHAENLRSIHALQKMGCQQEGRLRDFLHKVNGQGRTDLLLFSMLQNEWQDNVKSDFERSFSSPLKASK